MWKARSVRFFARRPEVGEKGQSKTSIVPELSYLVDATEARPEVGEDAARSGIRGERERGTEPQREREAKWGPPLFLEPSSKLENKFGDFHHGH